MPRTGKRRGQRIQTSLKTLFSAENGGGEATIAEISYSGARLTNTPLRPPLGSSVYVYVWLENQDEPFELDARVARHRPDGFAIEYEKPGQDTCQVVDLAAGAIVAAEALRQEVSRVEPSVPPPVPRKPKPPPLADLQLDAYPLPDLEEHAARVTEAVAAKRLALKKRLRAERSREPSTQ
jgi:hypothetical protein